MTQADILVRLEQRSEGPLHVNRGRVFSYRYAYARSADSQRDDEPGQDYLVFRELDDHFVFAACDGVSQSFFGDLAARFLGDALTNWLTQEIPPAMDGPAVQNAIHTFLSDLTRNATQRIENHPVPAEPALLYEVLLDKKARGSEAMFACGRIDAPSPQFLAGRVVLAWMGDMRLYLWRTNGRVNLGGSHETDHRWSTKRGPVGGQVNVYVAPLAPVGNPVTRLVVYSDGLSQLDSQLDNSLSNQALQQIIWDTKSRPDSDDITYFELYPAITSKPTQLAVAPVSAPSPTASKPAAAQPTRPSPAPIPAVEKTPVPASGGQPSIPLATTPPQRRRPVWPWALVGGVLLGLFGGLVGVSAGIFPFNSTPSPVTLQPAVSTIIVPTPLVTSTVAESAPVDVQTPTPVPQPTATLEESPSGQASGREVEPTTERSTPADELAISQVPPEATSVSDGTGVVLSGPIGGALEQAQRGDLRGMVVSIGGAFSDVDKIRFAWSVATFEEETGIEVQFLDSDDFASSINERVAAGEAPDIADFSEPGLLASLVRQGYVVDLTPLIPQDWLGQQYGPSWLQMSVMEGPNGPQTAGVWHRVNGKSLVWYPKAAFDAAGYIVPQTWGELVSLTQQMAESGQTPWCINAEGDTIGKQATDWTEELMLRTTSPENYDAWVRGELPFSSLEVQNAITQWSESWPAPDQFIGDWEATPPTYVPSTSMFDDSPGCWLLYQGDLNLFPDGEQVGVDYDFFHLPSVEGGENQPFLVDGHIMAMFNDRPEVRALMEYFALQESIEGWLATGGALAPHLTTTPDSYKQANERRIAELLAQATTVRFDGSKLMPLEVGSVSFPEGMARYVSRQADLTTVLGEIDYSWPSSEQGSTP